MEKMNLEPQIKSPQESDTATQENSSKKWLLESLSRRINRLKILTIALGSMFVGTENISAQTAHTQELAQGTVSADHMLYKMTTQESAQIVRLTHEVDSMIHVLKGKLEEKKSTVFARTQTIDNRLVSTVSLYDTLNVNVGASSPESYVVSVDNDTVKTTDNWILIGDTLSNEKQGHIKETKEAYFFESNSVDRTISHYTNKSGTEKGGEDVQFEYGEKIGEKDAILVQRFKKEEGVFFVPEGDLNEDGNSAGEFAVDGFNKLQGTLFGLKKKLEETIEKVDPSYVLPGLEVDNHK
jgi:hypothetical protein